MSSPYLQFSSESLAIMLEDANKRRNVQKIAAIEAALELRTEVEARIKDRLTPGDKNKPDTPDGELKPCGQADGVIYFDPQYAGDKSRGRMVVSGTQREAMNFLRDPLLCGEALDWKALNPGSQCLSFPIIDFLLRRHPEIQRDADGRAVVGCFVTSKAARNANQVEHELRWHVVKAPGVEGVWCVFYV